MNKNKTIFTILLALSISIGLFIYKRHTSPRFKVFDCFCNKTLDIYGKIEDVQDGYYYAMLNSYQGYSMGISQAKISDIDDDKDYKLVDCRTLICK